MPTEVEVLVDIRELLTQILYLQRRMVLRTITDQLRDVLGDERALKVLQESSASRSVRDVAAASKVPFSTVKRLWWRLGHMGLMREDPATPGRFVPVFSVAEMRAIVGESDE